MAKDKEQKKSFIVYEDMMNLVLSLPDEAALDFARTLFSYFLQKEYEPTGISAGMLETFKTKIDADIEEYKAKCQKNKDNIAAYWERKRMNTNEYERIQSNTNVLQTNSSRIHDNDNVYDNDNDDDNVYENENVKRTKKMCSKEHMKEIVDAWNSIFENTDVPKVTVVKSGSLREKAINARLKDNSKEDIINAMHSAAQSSFLTQSSWFSFDWFMKPNNFVKVIEGNYKDHEQKSATQNKPTDKLQEFYETAVKWAEGG